MVKSELAAPSNPWPIAHAFDYVSIVASPLGDLTHAEGCRTSSAGRCVKRHVPAKCVSGMMSTMDGWYRGFATLHDVDLAIDLTVDLVTTDDGLTYSWDGRGTTDDLRALNASGGTLVLPSGHEGVVHVAHTEITANEPGVLLRLHGGGPAPY